MRFVIFSIFFPLSLSLFSTHSTHMRLAPLYLTLLSSFALIQASPSQRPFMAPDDHGDIWSLCEDPSSHLLVGYRGGVSITPEAPKVGSDIHVQVKGNLCNYCYFLV